VLSAIALLNGCNHKKEAAPPPPAAEVGVVTVEPQAIVLETELPGRTCPYRIAEIRPQVNGIVQKRLFTEGSLVKAGDVLYKIDPAPFKAALANAEASLGVAKKNASRARASVKASEASIAQKKSILDLAKINRQRFEDLFKDKAVSASDRDQAVTNMDVAEAALNAAQAQADSDRQAVAAAEAAIKQAEAAIQTAKINLGYTSITAPISGRIGRSTVTDGALVTAYQPVALATIQQLDPIYVDVPQSTSELLRLRHRLEDGRLQQDGSNQNKVRLTLSDGGAYPQEGTLQFQDVTVDPTTGSVILRAVFPNPRGVLLPGMFVRASIKEGISPKTILVPQEAVSRNSKGEPLAFVVDQDGKAAVRGLSIDRAVGNRWMVNSGLVPGDRLIVEGLIRVRPGSPVTVVPANMAKEDVSQIGSSSRPDTNSHSN
jgi:membrane fusion protein (multidrug efflux system)